MPVSEAEKRIASFGCKHLVLTGGEPLLHQGALTPLLASLKEKGFFIEVETNGTLAPSPGLSDSVDCFNVSPKLSNSLIDETVRIHPDSLRSLASSKKAWFKFVVCEKSDVVEIEKLISVLEIPRDRVMLMPEGVDANTILARGNWLVEICKEMGFRFSPRLHILLYGTRRGT